MINLKILISKIIRYYKHKVDFFSPIGVVGRIYLTKINRKEYKNPPFSLFNERPVEYSFVFSQIAKKYPKKILDVGTGLTALPHLMANCGCQVTAIDNIKDYWPLGMFNRHYHIINDDIVNTKIRDSFDMITCISTLEHIENYSDAIKAMFNLLNRGGILILTFPYNENKFIDNVYVLDGSNVNYLPPFKTHSFSRQEINNWINNHNSTILDQEYWQFFTGEYWTVGDRLKIPKKVSVNEKHQISCIAFQKN